MNNKVNEILKILEEMHPEAGCALNYSNLYNLIIAVVLSAQTTDISVNNITPELFNRYPTVYDLANARQEEVQNIIHSIGLYKNKSKNIINLSKEIVEKFNGNVPDNMEELISLPGVGRKTANVVLSEGFGEQRIAVDTHVFRVSNRIGLISEKDPLSTEKALMKVIPNDKWTRMHHLLIFHGRKICDARNPKCNVCKINKICKYNMSNNV